MAKKLLILVVEDHILGGSLSWPKRELGAKVLYYKDAFDVKMYVEAHEPDVVLLDEPCPPENPADPCPGKLSDEFRAWLKGKCRSVRVVWDASDPPWHPILEGYKAADSFDCVVAADAATDWPHREGIDFAFPTPVDPFWYEETLPRAIPLGFSGSIGNCGPRKGIIGNLAADGLLTVRRREAHNLPYFDNADFVKRCRCVLNVAHTSSGRLQCKARAIEAALAGCLLFETAGSPTRNWLTPGVDYLEYTDPEEVRAFFASNRVDRWAAEFGPRARAKVLELDLPRRFWSAVMGEQL